MLVLAKRLWREDEGQGMVEYGLILALVAVIVIGALRALGLGIEGIFSTTTDALDGVGT